MIGDPLLSSQRRKIIDLAAKSRLPAIYSTRPWAEDSGLMAYGSNSEGRNHRAATYVDKILKGANPADLPVEQLTKFELAVNMKTAKALGLAIPHALLLRADRLVE